MGPDASTRRQQHKILRTMCMKAYWKALLDEILRTIIIRKRGQIFQLGVGLFVCLPDSWIHPPIDHQG